MRHLLVLALVCLVPISVLAAEWEEFLEEKGIRGYARSVGDSSLLEVRATLVIPAKIEVVGEVLRDVENLARPGTNCIEARFIEKPDRNHYTFYVAYSTPWPISDRDVVMKAAIRYDLALGRVVADLVAVKEPVVPLREGFVRITDLRAQFVIEYLSRDKTGLIYTSRTDPGGSIPTFLVNHSNKSSLRTNVIDLRSAAKDGKYIAAGASSPDRELVERLAADEARLTEIVTNRLSGFISDRALISTFVADRSVVTSLIKGDGKVGEILLHGWGSPESKREAVKVLLAELLANHTDNQAAIDLFVSDDDLIDSILFRKRGSNRVEAFIFQFRKKDE
ncbi:START domain-containing protein [Myxococcota bacterium]